jgi:hypothetical protein
MELDDVFWHDGNVDSFSYDEARDRIRLVCNLYSNVEARKRRRVEFQIDRIEHLVFAVPDMSEQRRNRTAGGISDGRLTKGQKTSVLRLNLAAGYLEVRGASVKVSPTTSRRRK